MAAGRREEQIRKIFAPLILGGLFLIAVSSGILFHQGKNTLTGLISRGPVPRTTVIYSRWRELRIHEALTPGYAVELLKQTGYQEVKGTPQQPGQYSYFYPTLAVFTRDFSYPDKTLPAQLVQVQFSPERIERLNAPALLDDGSWRLEPKVLRTLASRNVASRPRMSLSELPSYVPLAVIAVEDKRFYHHGAIDVLGVGRAAFVDLEQGRIRQGASTLSQQLARSIFLTANRTWSRKFMEALFAFYLEARFSKTQLLEMYLNQVYWGQEDSDSILGIESASQAYFGHPAATLSLGEAALLAGLLQSPNHYSPRAFPAVALERRRLVLRLMLGQGLISKWDYDQAQRETLKLAPSSAQKQDAAYFLATLQDGLEQKYAVTDLSGLGWRIFTTLDPVLQPLAEKAMPSPSPLPKGRGPTATAGVGLLPPGEGARRADEGRPQAALVVMDPATGGILAWVGGTNYQTSAYDRAALSRRQPGSAFKPFVYLAAIDQKKVTTATLLDDKPIVLKEPTGSWIPQNYDRKYRGKASVWDSLVGSLNVPTVNLAIQTGLGAVADYARRAGIQSALREVPSLALGTSEVTLPELTNAYATLADQGIYQPAYRIEAILDTEGHPVEGHVSAAQPVFDPASVFLVTQMLEAVFKEGTARAAQELGFTTVAAGKTGTSENYQDAWFLGYTSALVCGVWVGFDKPRSLGHSAAGIALPVWISFMKKAVTVMPAEPFPPPPPRILWKTIDPRTGFLARSGCKERRQVAFLEGTAPTQFCPVHPGGIFGFFYRLRH